MNDEAEQVKGQHEIGRDFDASVYSKQYFEGGLAAGISGYDSYLNCKQIVEKQFEIIDEVMRDRVTNKTNLDAGCAYGFSCNKLRELGWQSFGFDISEYAISKAIELFGDEGFFRADAIDNFPSSAEPYGLVTAVEFFEHIPSNQVDSILADCASSAEWGLFLVNGRIEPREDIHKIDADHGHLNFNNMAWWITKMAKYGEIDFTAMYELNLLADEVEDINWVNRFVVVKFA